MSEKVCDNNLVVRESEPNQGLEPLDLKQRFSRARRTWRQLSIS